MIPRKTTCPARYRTHHACVLPEGHGGNHDCHCGMLWAQDGDDW